MIEAYKKMWKYGFTFTGRTSRADFWYAYLANFLVGVIFGFITGVLHKAHFFAVLSSSTPQLTQYDIIISLPLLSVTFNFNM